MPKHQHKTTSHKTPQGRNLSFDLQSIEKIFKNELTASKGGISSCLPFLSAKTPQNYKSVLSWLASIGEAEAKNELSGKSIDTAAITTALQLSIDYAASTKVGGSIASTALNDIVDGLVGAFGLNINDVNNPDDLSAYCVANNIEIPAEIQALLPQKAQLLPATS